MLLAAICCALCAIGVTQITSTLSAINRVGELQYGEAIIYGQASRVLNGEPLYQPLDRAPFTVVAYTPVYYWVVAWLRVPFGPGFAPGRAFAMVAGLVAVALVGLLAARYARSRTAGAFATLLFLALGLPWVYPDPAAFYDGDAIRTGWANLVANPSPSMPWLGYYKEDVLGVAFALAAIAILSRGTSTPALVGAGLLAALAILTKQTLIAALVAGAFWLWRQDRSRAPWFAGAAFGVTGGVCLALEITTGAFFQNAVGANVNPMRLDVLASTVAMLVRFQWGPLLIATAYALYKLRQPDDGMRLPIYYWLACIPALSGLAKAGSNHNHWTEFAAATAVLAAVALWDVRRPWKTAGLDTEQMILTDQRRQSGRAMVMWNTQAGRLVQSSKVPATAALLLLGATTAGVLPLLGGMDRLIPSWPGANRAEAAEQRALIERVRNTQGAVLSSPLELLALADQPILLEPYVFNHLYVMGRWDPAPVVRRVCAGDVGLLIFYNPVEQGSGVYHGYGFWPLPVLRALQETMVLQERRGGLYLYVPHAPEDRREASAARSVCAD